MVGWRYYLLVIATATVSTLVTLAAVGVVAAMTRSRPARHRAEPPPAPYDHGDYRHNSGRY